MEKMYDYNLEGMTIEIENTDMIRDNQKKRFAAMFIAIRSQSGMNRKEFAQWLGVPYRTMQDWERGVSQVPDYVLRLVAYKVNSEKEKNKL
jgi:DNA-binding transcriptional regulator YiaG